MCVRVRVRACAYYSSSSSLACCSFGYSVTLTRDCTVFGLSDNDLKRKKTSTLAAGTAAQIRYFTTAKFVNLWSGKW
jgi:hypothetical protein